MKRKYEPPLIKRISLRTSILATSPLPESDPDMELNDEVAEEQM